MKIAVIDGQGGGIGKLIITALRESLPEDTVIYGLGANALATTAMLKAGANEGATGSYAIAHVVQNVDIITGSVSILVARSMCGEITAEIVTAIGNASAKKILLPINRVNVQIAGVVYEPLPHQISRLAEIIAEKYR